MNGLLLKGKIANGQQKRAEGFFKVFIQLEYVWFYLLMIFNKCLS